MEKNYRYSIYPHCFIVQGRDCNAIFNSQHADITFVSDDILELIKQFELKSIEELMDLYQDCLDDFKSIISFLLSKKILFIRRCEDVFQNINLEYISPEYITNMVVEYSEDYNFEKLLEDIDTVLVKYLEIRLVSALSDNAVNDILKFMYTINTLPVKSVQIISDYVNQAQLLELAKLDNFNKVVNLIFYNSPINRNSTINKKNIEYVKLDYESVRNYNNDFKKNLILDLAFFIEANNYNTYYNKRVCIDRNGNIKNCLKNEKIFGNINIDNLLDVIHRNDFQELWFVGPDKIIDVRDSALRYNMFITNNLLPIGDGLYRIDNESI